MCRKTGDDVCTLTRFETMKLNREMKTPRLAIFFLVRIEIRYRRVKEARGIFMSTRYNEL